MILLIERQYDAMPNRGYARKIGMGDAREVVGAEIEVE